MDVCIDVSKLNFDGYNFNLENCQTEESVDTLVSPIYTKAKKKTRDNFFEEELSKLPFGEDIRKEAYSIYLKMNLPIKRKNNRKFLKFFCIYNAHLKLNKIKDVKYLAKTMEIDSTDLNKIFKAFSYENTGYLTENMNISPLDYIEYYYKFTELRMDEVSQVFNFGSEIIKKESFEGEFPQVVAVAIIIYYIKIMNNMVISQKFHNNITYSKSMINKVVNQIGSIYNS